MSAIWAEVATIGDLLVRAVHLHPQRDALVFPDARIDYAGLYERASRVARGLVALGLKRGSHVGLLMGNSVEFAAALFGIALSGCVAVPLNARHKTAELAYIVANARLAAIMTTSGAKDYVDFAALLEQALPSLAATREADAGPPEAPNLRHVILMRGDARPGFIDPAAFEERASA